MNHIALVVITLVIAALIIQRYVKSTLPLFAILFLGLFLTSPSILAISTLRKEGFKDKGKDTSGSAPMVDIIGSRGVELAPAPYTSPTARNPFMNVLVDELKYNPTRSPATSVLDPSVQITMDDFFRTEFSRDPTDVFGRNQSQREFITMPSTSIPNDVDSYQNWLYKIPGKTCKEGGREACLPGTDGGVIPWLNQNQ